MEKGEQASSNSILLLSPSASFFSGFLIEDFWWEGRINLSGIQIGVSAFWGKTHAYPLPKVVNISGHFQVPVKISFHNTKVETVCCMGANVIA